MIFQPLVLPSILNRPLLQCFLQETPLPETFLSFYEVLEEDISDSKMTLHSDCSLVCVLAKSPSSELLQWFSRFLPLSVPILVASESFQTIETCMTYGIDDFYVGPLNSPLFPQRINALIRGFHFKHKDDPLSLAFMAYYDGLTGLLSRARFESELKQRCFKDHEFSLLYLDLDGFKAINDHKGHETGDMVLRQVASRLKQSVKKSDLVARMGGDEFAVLLEGSFSVHELKSVTERLISLVSAPYHCRQQVLSVGVSIGAVRYPKDGVTAENLLNHADQMMYAAKKLGKNHVQLWAENPKSSSYFFPLYPYKKNPTDLE